MVIRRIITGVSVAVVVALLIWLGDPWFTAAACLISCIATFEFYRMVKTDHTQPLTYLGLVFSILFVLNAHSPYSITCPLLFVLITVVPLLWMLFRPNKENAFADWGWTVAGILYIGWMLSFYVLIRSLDNGMWWVYLVVACTALSDVFAYAVGSTIGKHALASSISPGKTWEGSAGGLAASIIFALILGTWFQLPLNLWQLVMAGLIIGFFSLLGDLVESLLKRNMHTKDAGRLLPGHGGILDRIDSHLLIAPVAYYLILLVNNQGWLPS
ncbi:MAG: phosphatidate cytidylyltransferase [Dehalococcoidia bacterium]|nr:phosphatidate cytidylyltransferase [Dehalococcoidia bacterium]MDD5493640.1 phosphatidate cytidylyltransferase [Dehalococcoidia bacterium]